MSLLVFALVIVIIVALLVWAVSIIPMDYRLGIAVQVAVIIVAVLIIAQRAGLV